jgi:hypothetical protein
MANARPHWAREAESKVKAIHRWQYRFVLMKVY